MRLADYLTDRQLKDATFAAQIGVSRQAVGRYKFGERRPDWDILQRIAKATGGEVTPNDFLDASEEPEATPAPPEGAAAVVPGTTCGADESAESARLLVDAEGSR